MIINKLLLDAKKVISGGVGFGCVCADGALEVEVLLAHVLGCSREDLMRDGDLDVVASEDVKLFLKYVGEVACGKPVAYITGSKEFYGMDFYVDERVLVPRPETEMIVDEVLNWLGEHQARFVESREVKMLDIGTGSLNITSAIVRHYGNVFAHAVDVSDEALEVARINRDAHGLETHVEIYRSDLLSDVEERKFDVIVANLPYIGEVRNRNLADNVLKYEPGVALWGGRDGLELYKKMIQEILEKKVEFDLMVCEFGFGQKRALRAMLSKFFDQDFCKDCAEGGSVRRFEWEVKNDLGGIPRIFVVKRVGV